MNRRLLIVPVVGVAALAGSQLLSGGESELPPEPVFPTVVGTDTSQDWTDDDWSVNRFVDDPFEASFAGQPPADFDPLAPPAEVSLEPDTVPATTAPPLPPAAAAAPTAPPTTTTPPPTTTARDLSEAPPLAEDGSGVDLPEIDDLPDPLGDPAVDDSDPGAAEPGAGNESDR